MTAESMVQLDTNVDDLDPRLLPRVIDRLLDAGAVDAWLTPIVMKKGRPAHTISALCRPDALDEVRRCLFVETSTIGVRETSLIRHALDRRVASVTVDGHEVDVKLALIDDRVVNVSVEWEHVARIADLTGRPAVEVLGDAEAAARLLT